MVTFHSVDIENTIFECAFMEMNVLVFIILEMLTCNKDTCV